MLRRYFDVLGGFGKGRGKKRGRGGEAKATLDAWREFLVDGKDEDDKKVVNKCKDRHRKAEAKAKHKQQKGTRPPLCFV